jgi:hypothetical protein
LLISTSVQISGPFLATPTSHVPVPSDETTCPNQRHPRRTLVHDICRWLAIFSSRLPEMTEMCGQEPQSSEPREGMIGSVKRGRAWEGLNLHNNSQLLKQHTLPSCDWPPGCHGSRAPGKGSCRHLFSIFPRQKN